MRAQLCAVPARGTHHQCCRFSRNIAEDIPKIIYFYYQKVCLLDQSAVKKKFTQILKKNITAHHLESAPYPQYTCRPFLRISMLCPLSSLICLSIKEQPWIPTKHQQRLIWWAPRNPLYCPHYQCCCFQNKIKYFLDTLIQKRSSQMMKRNNVPSYLTDISASKRTTAHYLYQWRTTSLRPMMLVSNPSTQSLMKPILDLVLGQHSMTLWITERQYKHHAPKNTYGCHHQTLNKKTKFIWHGRDVSRFIKITFQTNIDRRDESMHIPRRSWKPVRYFQVATANWPDLSMQTHRDGWWAMVCMRI